LGTQVFISFEAIGANTAGGENPCHSHPVTYLKFSDPVSFGFHPSYYLMSGDHREMGGRSPSFDLIQFGMAYTAGRYLQKQISGIRNRIWKSSKHKGLIFFGKIRERH
jgi:hypothetical protein